MPNVTGIALASLNPAFFNTDKKRSPSGNAFTDSGKYVYAELSFENNFPTAGVMTLK